MVKPHRDASIPILKEAKGVLLIPRCREEVRSVSCSAAGGTRHSHERAHHQRRCPRGSTRRTRAFSRSRRALTCVAESAGCARQILRILPEGAKNAHIPRGTRSETIPIRAKKVTPTVAAGSARAAREVDADNRGEGGDGGGESRAARGMPRARPARHQRASARLCRLREKNCAVCA